MANIKKAFRFFFIIYLNFTASKKKTKITKLKTYLIMCPCLK